MSDTNANDCNDRAGTVVNDVPETPQVDMMSVQNVPKTPEPDITSVGKNKRDPTTVSEKTPEPDMMREKKQRVTPSSSRPQNFMRPGSFMLVARNQELADGQVRP